MCIQKEQIQKAKNAIKDAEALLITAGAGIGVDSGLPDFRGNTGFWKAYPPLQKLGISFMEMANPQWFTENPSLAWAFYGHRLNLYRETVPHDGFNILLQFSETIRKNYFVFTSNVDGQFQKAGFDNDKIEECHGSIHHMQCIRPCNFDIWDGSEVQVDVDTEHFKTTSPLPLCPHCSSYARPNILMFGDWYWISDRSEEQSARMNKWLMNVAQEKQKLVIIEIGAGKAVPTVRLKSIAVAQKLDGTLIRINPRDSEVPSGHISIGLGSKQGIQEILD